MLLWSVVLITAALVIGAFPNRGSVRDGPVPEAFPAVPASTAISATLGSDISSRVEDSNGDGFAERLLIDVPVQVTQAGSYTMDGDLEPTDLVHRIEAHKATRLGPGTTVVTLGFSGIAANRLPSDGPWSVSLRVRRLDGDRLDTNTTEWTTPAYRRSEFTSVPVAVLNGTVDGRPRAASIWIVDTSRGFSTHAQADGLGNYALTLYPGTFNFLVFARLGASGVASLTLTGNTDRNLPVSIFGTEYLNTTFAFSGPDAVRETLAFAARPGAPFVRLLADLWGNLDGEASPDEIALTAPYARYTNSPFGFLPQTSNIPDWASIARIRMDGDPAIQSAAVLDSVEGPGNLLSPEPLVVTASADWNLNRSLAASDPHTVNLTLWCEGGSVSGTNRIHLPAGSNATLTVSRGTAQNLGAGDWRIDAPSGCSPSGFDPWAYVEIQGVIARDSGAVWTFPMVLVLAVAVAAGGVLGFVLWRRRRPRS